MKAGWKTRIDERRYFEEKRMEWRKRVTSIQNFKAQMRMLDLQRDAEKQISKLYEQHLDLVAKPVNSTFPKL